MTTRKNDGRNVEPGGIVRIRPRRRRGSRTTTRVTVADDAEGVLDNRPESIRLVLTEGLRTWLHDRSQEWHDARRVEPQTPHQRTAELRRPYRSETEERARWTAGPQRRELGLVFRTRTIDGANAATKVRKIIERMRGAWLHEARIPEIHYHAALVAIPRGHARRLRDRPDTSRLGRRPAVMTLAPESVAVGQ